MKVREICTERTVSGKTFSHYKTHSFMAIISSTHKKVLRNQMISVACLLGTEAKYKIQLLNHIFQNWMLGKKTNQNQMPRLWLIMKMSKFHRIWHENYPWTSLECLVPIRLLKCLNSMGKHKLYTFKTCNFISQDICYWFQLVCIKTEELLLHENKSLWPI